MEEKTFQNLPSKRLYDFLSKKVEDKSLTHQQIADTLGVYQKNPASYFHALRTGITSVKLDHILKAQEHFGLNPCDLFKSKSAAYAVEDEESLPAFKENDASKSYDQIKMQLEIIKSQQETIKILVADKGSAGGRSAASM